MRWRPPRQTPSPYITPAGAAALRDELDRLWRQERPQVTAQVQAAAKNGDRSENGDYIYGKRRLREIDRRVHYLRRRLTEVVVIAEPPADTGRIRFGARVRLADDRGREFCYRLVGSDEIEPAKGWISIDSPLARALLGRGVGDLVAPAGRGHWQVLAIAYGTDAQESGEGR